MPIRWRSIVDTAADRAFPIGYSRLGFRLREPGWDDDDPAPGSCRGKVVVVTGANSGLGLATVARLARLGAAVHMVVRDAERGEHARAKVRAEAPGAEIELSTCDISNLAEVRELAGSLARRQQVIDVLVHNAGVLPAQRSTTPEGHELTLATHVLGPVLLTELLRPALSGSADPRVIMVSSGGMYSQRAPVEDPEYRHGRYRGATAYARTKRVQVELLPVLASRYASGGATVHAMHPGWASTPGVASSLPGFHWATRALLRTPEQGADTISWLAATSTRLPSGRFWHDRRARPTNYLPATRGSDATRRQLWNYCASALALQA